MTFYLTDTNVVTENDLQILKDNGYIIEYKETKRTKDELRNGYEERIEYTFTIQIHTLDQIKAIGELLRKEIKLTSYYMDNTNIDCIEICNI